MCCLYELYKQKDEYIVDTYNHTIPNLVFKAFENIYEMT